MKTRHKEWCNYFRTVINIFVITTFLTQNVAWTFPALQKETLAPGSGFLQLASRVDLEIVCIGYYLEQQIIYYNKRHYPKIYSIADLFNRLLKRNKYRILQDLHRFNINTIFHPHRIELISSNFTLTFLDATQYPEEGFYHIPGTGIRMDMYKNGHLLPSSPRKIVNRELEGASPPVTLGEDKQIPSGSIAQALTDLFTYREILKNQPITISNTINPERGVKRWRRENITRGSPFSRTTIRWELNSLAQLGFLHRYTHTGENRYYITSKLLKAPPEAIEEICRFSELQYPSLFPENPDELKILMARLDGILLFHKLHTVQQYSKIQGLVWEVDIDADILANFYQFLREDPYLSELGDELDDIVKRLVLCILISTLKIKDCYILKPLWDMILLDRLDSTAFRGHMDEFLFSYNGNIDELLVLLEDIQFKTSQRAEALARLVQEIKERFFRAERILNRRGYREEGLSPDRLNYYVHKKIEFLEKIKEGDTIVIFYHEDADGVSSAVLETLFLDKYFEDKININIQYVPVSYYSSSIHLQKSDIAGNIHFVLLDFNYQVFENIAEQHGIDLTQINKLVIDHHDERMKTITPGEEGIPERRGWIFISPKRCFGIEKNFPAGNLVRLLNSSILQISGKKLIGEYYAEIYIWLAGIAIYGDKAQIDSPNLIGTLRREGIAPLRLRKFAYQVNMVSQAGAGGSVMVLKSLLGIARSEKKINRIFRGKPIDSLMWKRYTQRAELLEKQAEAIKQQALAGTLTGPLLFYYLPEKECRIGNKEYRLTEIVADKLQQALPGKVVVVAKKAGKDRLKVEIRCGRKYKNLDMGEIMERLFRGGGHKEAGGAEIKLKGKDLNKVLHNIKMSIEKEISKSIRQGTL